MGLELIKNTLIFVGEIILSGAMFLWLGYTAHQSTKIRDKLHEKKLAELNNSFPMIRVRLVTKSSDESQITDNSNSDKQANIINDIK